jgi:hypothetical protein
MIDASLPFRTDPLRDTADGREVERLLADGLLVHVLLDAVAAADSPVDQVFRATALRLFLPERLHSLGAAVAQAAAAWLWCGGSPPRFVDVAVPPGRGRVAAPHLVVHERRVPPDDVTVIEAPGGPPLTVTTPVRTAADLLRTLPAPDALVDAVRVAAALAPTEARGDESDVAADVAACLERMPGARGVARARRMLRDWPVPARPQSVDALAGNPVGVEDTLHPPDGGHDVVEVRRVGHLEGEARDRHPVA